MAIHNLTVIGYCSIRRLRLPLRPVNVLTGPNGCGKSNLYNAVFLLAKAAEGGFARAIAEDGGMPSVLWAGPRRRLSKKELVRVILAVATGQFSQQLECGLPAPGGSHDFAFDPEVKEAPLRLEMIEGETRVAFGGESINAVTGAAGEKNRSSNWSPQRQSGVYSNRPGTQNGNPG